MQSPKERAKIVQRQSEELKRYLRTLHPNALDHPSACGRWRVGGVVAHLTGGAELYTDSISRGLQGDSSSSKGRPSVGSLDSASLGEVNAQRAITLRDRLGAELLTTFDKANDRLNDLLAVISPSDWDLLCYHPYRLFSVRTFVNLRMFELALHGWDIRSRVEQSAHLSPETFPTLIEVIGAFCEQLLLPDVKVTPSERYRFILSGQAPETIDITVDGKTSVMKSAEQSPADVTFRCDTEIFVLLMTGRLGFDSVIDDGRLVFEGRQEPPKGFGAWFRGSFRPMRE